MYKVPLPKVLPDAILQQHREYTLGVIPFTTEEIEYSLLRVECIVPISTLQHHSNLPKNACF